MKPIINLLLILFVCLFSAQFLEAQDMTRQDKRALIKAIRKGEGYTKGKDSIIYVDKIREVEVVREVPTYVEKIKVVPHDTCLNLKSRQEIRLDFKREKEENEKAIKLAKLENEGKIRLMRLEIDKAKLENKALRDSLNGIVKIRRVEGTVAKDTVDKDRKAKIVDSRSKVKVARSKSYWLWGVAFIVALVILFILRRHLPRIKLF